MCSSRTRIATRSIRTTRRRSPRSNARVRSPHAAARGGALAAGAGVASAFATVEPPELFLFEPHQPELCNFTPTTFVDLTPGIEQQRAARAVLEARVGLRRE